MWILRSLTLTGVLIFTCAGHTQTSCQSIFSNKDSAQNIARQHSPSTSKAPEALLMGRFDDLELSSLFFAKEIKQNRDEFQPASKSQLRQMFKNTPFERDIEGKGVTKWSLWHSKEVIPDYSSSVRTKLKSWLSHFRAPRFRRDFSTQYVLNSRTKEAASENSRDTKIIENSYTWSFFAQSISNVRSRVALEFDAIPLGKDRDGVKTLGDLIRRGALHFNNKKGQTESIILAGEGLQIARVKKNGVQFYYLELEVISANSQKQKEILFLPPSLNLTRMSTLYFATFGLSKNVWHPYAGKNKFGNTYEKAKINLDHIIDSPQDSLAQKIQESEFNINNLAVRGFNSTYPVVIELGSGVELLPYFRKGINPDNFYTNDFIPIFQKSKYSAPSEKGVKISETDMSSPNTKQLFEREIEVFKKQSPDHAEFWEQLGSQLAEWKIFSPRFIEYVPFREASTNKGLIVNSERPSLELVTISTSEGVRLFYRSVIPEINTQGQLVPFEYGGQLRQKLSLTSFHEPYLSLELNPGDGGSLKPYISVFKSENSNTSFATSIRRTSLNESLQKSAALRSSAREIHFTEVYEKALVPLQNELSYISKVRTNTLVHSKWISEFGAPLLSGEGRLPADRRRMQWEVEQSLKALDQTTAVYRDIKSEFELWYNKLSQDTQQMKVEDSSLSSGNPQALNIKTKLHDLERIQQELSLNIEVITSTTTSLGVVKYNLRNVLQALQLE